MQKQNNSGIYIFELFLTNPTNIEHPKFYKNSLEIGYYYYVGSAQRNLQQRVMRHLKIDKKIHWHIDYLTTDRKFLKKNVYLIPGALKNEECKIVDKMYVSLQLRHPIINFGNSDCRNCKSHLLYSTNRLIYSQLLSLYQSTVLFIPSSKEIV